jgi:ribonuclease HI
MFYIYIDGACSGNPGPSAIGIVIENEYHAVIDMWGEYIGLATNNIAEYMALKKALLRAKELSLDNITVYSDSLLLVRQLRGIFKVRSSNLYRLFCDVKEIEKSFNKVEYAYVPREKNYRADSLAKMALKIRGRYPPP